MACTRSAGPVELKHGQTKAAVGPSEEGEESL